MNAEALTHALGGRWFGRYGTAQCPAHADRNPSLKLSDGDKAVLLRCFANCETSAVIDALRSRGLWSGTPSDAPPIDLEARERERAAKIEKRRVQAFAIWEVCRPARRTVVEAYLRHRGITLPVPGALRFHPALRHAPTGLDLPAMVAVVVGPDGRFSAIHRTYLRADGRGKAPVSDPKMALGPLSCGAIRLFPVAPVMGLAEGIETALSAAVLYRIPVWSCVSTGGLVAVILPDDVTEPVIFADNGVAGQRSAKEAALRFAAEGRAPRIISPDDPSHSDFNDTLRALNAARGAA